MAAMSVIGIDFGNDGCYVAVARAGGIETIANDYSLRGTPSCVAFSGKNRVLGVAAKNQMVTNMKNTIYGFKRLLGRKWNDQHAQREMRALSYKTSQQPDGSIGIHVQYLGEEHVFSPEQITAMLFTKLKEVSESALQTVVNDCVISVPSYFTQNERQSLLDAARIAGLNVLRLFNETTATALCYGIYKQDLPALETPPRNVVFVDCGYTSLQVSICAFHKGKLKMLASAADSSIGGREIDIILADYFCKDFQARYKIDAHTNPRAYLRLLAEVEKLKKQMSANSTTLPLNIECFMEEMDVHGTMKRADMEQMCGHLFKRVESTLKQCLADSKLKLEDIHSVELAGGSSRVPSIKKLVEDVFGKPPSTTLNQDESVARGCALQCAMLSPAVRVREFSVTDLQPYPIKITWDGNQGDKEEVEIFDYNHQVPYSKYLTLYQSSPFTLTASYISPPVSYPHTHIGVFQINGVKPTPEGEPSKVKIKIRLNLNGILTIASAAMIEKRDLTVQELEEEVKQEQQQNAAAHMEMEGQQQQQDKKDKADQEAQAKEPPAPEVLADRRRRDLDADDAGKSGRGYYSSRILSWFTSGDGKKKIPVRQVDLTIESRAGGLPQKDLDAATEKEYKMIAEDKQEKERIDARNALEEYVYYLRGKILDEDELATFVVPSDREALSRVLDETENWLYEEGEECNKQVYCDRLAALKAQGEPIKERKMEWEGRNFALDELAGSLQIAKKHHDQIKASRGSKDDKFAHISDDDLKQADKLMQEKNAWIADARMQFAVMVRTQTPSITVSQIRANKQSVESTIMPILNKPKPWVEPPAKADDKAKEQQSDKNSSSNNQSGDGHNSNNQQQSPKEDNMDVE